MGYTLVVDPAVNPGDALHAHLELALTPVIDRGAAPHPRQRGFPARHAARPRGRRRRAGLSSRRCSAAGRGLGVKVINAGGAAAFKSNVRAFSFDDVVPGYGVSSRDIVLALQEAVQALGVPHPLHVHCNNLGLAGSADTAHATIEAAGDLPMHLAHLQFYGYGTEGKRGISSAAAQLAERVNAHAERHHRRRPGDVRADRHGLLRHAAPVRPAAASPSREKWTLWDGDGNGGGIFPIVYGEKEFTSALQWAIGLELFLLIDDPWQVYFTTDHPNGAPFTRYPEILHLLMDADERGALDGAAAEERNRDDDACRRSGANIRSPRSRP